MKRSRRSSDRPPVRPASQAASPLDPPQLSERVNFWRRLLAVPPAAATGRKQTASEAGQGTRSSCRSIYLSLSLSFSHSFPRAASASRKLYITHPPAPAHHSPPAGSNSKSSRLHAALWLHPISPHFRLLRCQRQRATNRRTPPTPALPPLRKAFACCHWTARHLGL